MSVLHRSIELLEPYDGKLSCTVLRGESARKGADLPDTVKIQTKDKRCRIQIYDIICEDAYQTGLGTQNKIPKIQPFLGDEPEQKTKSLGKGLSKKKAVEMMNDLKTFFESIINGLEKEINDTTDDNW